MDNKISNKKYYQLTTGQGNKNSNCKIDWKTLTFFGLGAFSFCVRWTAFVMDDATAKRNKEKKRRVDPFLDSLREPKRPNTLSSKAKTKKSGQFYIKIFQACMKKIHTNNCYRVFRTYFTLNDNVIQSNRSKVSKMFFYHLGSLKNRKRRDAERKFLRAREGEINKQQRWLIIRKLKILWNKTVIQAVIETLNLSIV